MTTSLAVQLCGARAKGTGQPCKRPAMENGRCRFHGGLTPKGPASVHWKHGRKSRYAIPPKLASLTAALLEDPDVLDLVPNIQLVDAKIQEALDGITRESTPAWEGVVAAARAVREAASDTSRAEAFRELMEAIDRGGAEREAFREVWNLTERRRRLVRTEAQRRSSERDSLSVERVTGLMYLLVDVVFQHVQDLKVRAAIIEDVRRIQQSSGTGKEN